MPAEGVLVSPVSLRAALVGIMLTTILGTLIIGRLSRNFLVRGLCSYVELFRNIPVLIQLLMWYFVLGDGCLPWPCPAPAWHFYQGGIVPGPEWEQGHVVSLAGFAMGIVVAWLSALGARDLRGPGRPANRM
jgi:general L-amino acid transport system permease protein